jgi:glucose-1-phosphate adenylyltransferase
MSVNPKRVICIIMGGGQGTRLYPLTKLRCKPAVPLAGQFRLIDIPISNCINSGLNQIYILTQFNTASLHRHIFETFKFDAFGGGFVEVLAAEQREHGAYWYQGTADAVRQNLRHFDKNKACDLFVILSGDQLYRMDLQRIIEHHIACNAEVTVAAHPVPIEEAPNLGILQADENYRVTSFLEKPKARDRITPFIIPNHLSPKALNQRPSCLASMGIYVFNSDALHEALASTATDFGKEVIPGLLGHKRLYSYIFDGYWEDIGTVRSFFEANLMLADPVPAFNFFDNRHPIFTRPRYLPATKINSCQAERAVLADGCILSGATLKRCVIGIRSYIAEGTYLENVVMMGADHFNTLEDFEKPHNPQLPPLGIGRNCHIVNAIIDKNARIGHNVRLSPAGKPDQFEQGSIYIRDGILIVTKDGIIPDNTIL